MEPVRVKALPQTFILSEKDSIFSSLNLRQHIELDSSASHHNLLNHRSRACPGGGVSGCGLLCHLATCSSFAFPFTSLKRQIPCNAGRVCVWCSLWLWVGRQGPLCQPPGSHREPSHTPAHTELPLQALPSPQTTLSAGTPRTCN